MFKQRERNVPLDLSNHTQKHALQQKVQSNFPNVSGVVSINKHNTSVDDLRGLPQKDLVEQ